MKYREFGKIGWESSVIGFRVMSRLQNISGNIDEDEPVNIIRYAVDRGINYLDSGYPYNMKAHEALARVTGKAVKEGYREKVRIAATLPSLLVKTGDDFNRYLDRQLEWLDIDYIDFYIIGFLNRDTWSKLKDMKILNHAEKALSEKRIKNIGFYMHDDFQTLRNIISSYDNWALSQFSYSIMDVNHHPGIGGIKFANDSSLAVVVSDPLLNGRLIKNIPDTVSGIWKNSEKERNIAEWGLNWAWNFDEVSVVLCDMDSIQQVEENAGYAEKAEADSISVREEILISKVRDAYQDLRPVQCTACGCCMPCPVNLDVPRIFEIYNDAVIYKDTA
ncbi:aldo/keto reductase, partial [Thermodesulfobacteriota bacterium]